jgi:hypothetical protein
VRLEPLYRLTFHYPEKWLVELDDERGLESESFMIAEGRAEGRISGRMRGANQPRRRTDMTYLPDFNGVIETDDGATILFHLQGRGRPQDNWIVGFGTHFSSDERYRWLNDSVCALAGEVRPEDERTDVVVDLAKLVWEPLPEQPRYDSPDGD